MRLSREFEITLFSFEKPGAPKERVREELDRHGIEWRPLRYHRRPPIVSTAWDSLRGRRALVREARKGPPAIVHVRSYVPALIAMLSRRRTGGALLFDIRGFWADERVEGGLWRPGGLLYRLSKRWERRFFDEADAIVTLSHASLPQITTWTGERSVRVRVIPTCVDMSRFSRRPLRPGGPHAVWSGSVGTWYRFDLAARVARALSLPLTVLTRQDELAREKLGGFPASVRTVPSEEVPAELFAGDIGMCLITPTFSKTASAPTRFAEYLAIGMPVLVTRGVGDLEALVDTHGVGVVLEGETAQDIATGADKIRSLARNPEIPGRCRALAARLFDVDSGSAAYAELYRELTRG